MANVEIESSFTNPDKVSLLIQLAKNGSFAAIFATPGYLLGQTKILGDFGFKLHP